jgi:hypothetical protein
MSKQLNFFIHRDDLVPIFDFFNGNGIKYVFDKINNADDIVLYDLPHKHGKPYDKICLTSEQFADHLYFIFDEERAYYDLDREKSYILEFSPALFYSSSERVIDRGRFYCKTDYFVSNNERVVKADEFKAWVDKVFRMFKKQFLIRTDFNKSILFSSKTLAWMKENNGQIDAPFLKITI